MKAFPSFGPKQSWEAYYIGFDFFRLIEIGDTIDSALIVVTDSNGNDVTSSLTDVTAQTTSGTQVNVYVQAGTSGMTYKLTCKAETTEGERYEMEASILVKDL